MNALVYTNDNCISRNKCVRVCTSPGASYTDAEGASSVVHINKERCISCGACFEICEHNARDFLDGTAELPDSSLTVPGFRCRVIPVPRSGGAEHTPALLSSFLFIIVEALQQ